MTERTLVIIKPDAVRRGLVGTVLARYDRFVKADHIRELAALWNTRTSEYPDGHYSVTMQPTLIAPLASGLLEIWDTPRNN